VCSSDLGDITAATKYRSQFFEASQEAEDPQTRCWGYIERGEIELFLGNHKDAISSFEAAADFLENVSDMEGIWAFGQLARAYLRIGDRSKALEVADETLTRMGSTIPTAFYAMEGFMGAADVYLTVLEEKQKNGEKLPRDLLKKASKSIAGPKAFSRSFPIGNPRKLLWMARLANLKGRPRKSIILLNRALQEAQRLNMPYDIALTRYHLGIITSDSDKGLGHLETALEAFEQLGARTDADLTRAAIGSI